MNCTVALPNVTHCPMLLIANVTHRPMLLIANVTHCPMLLNVQVLHAADQITCVADPRTREKEAKRRETEEKEDHRATPCCVSN